MELEEDYFRKNVLTAIDPNTGEIINIEADLKEKKHYQAYKRFNSKLGNILGEIGNDPGHKLANAVAKAGYIHFWPFEVAYNSRYRDLIFMAFPYKPTIPQLRTLRSFHTPLAYVSSLLIFKKPNQDEFLDYMSKDIIKGLNNLVLYERECYNKAVLKRPDTNVEK